MKKKRKKKREKILFRIAFMRLELFIYFSPSLSFFLLSKLSRIYPFPYRHFSISRQTLNNIKLPFYDIYLVLSYIDTLSMCKINLYTSCMDCALAWFLYRGGFFLVFSLLFSFLFFFFFFFLFFFFFFFILLHF